ncbi:MAG: tetratricopeptide repeat protein [Myxococcales bacterium]|nr:tetratricopeptide repeat protein [Myxococcales bacterium]
MRTSRLSLLLVVLTTPTLSVATPPEPRVETTDAPSKEVPETPTADGSDAAVIIEPAETVIRKAHQALKDERYRDATELLTRAASSSPDDPDLQNELGVALFQQRAFKAAALAFARATKLRPQAPNPWMNLATALRLSGEAKRAAAAYHTYLQLRPMDVHAIYGLALAFLDFADYDKSEKTLVVAERLCDDDDVTEGLPGGSDAAEALLPRIARARERIALERTELGKPVAERADARRLRGDLQGALVLYDQAVMEAPKDLDLLVRRGRTRAAMQELEGARMDYESALAIDPRHPAALDALKALGQP